MITPAGAEAEVTAAAERVYEALTARGVEVLWDDRDLRGGVKFKDADLLGLPVRVTIGKKSLAERIVEIKLRREADRRAVPLASAADEVARLVTDLKAELTAEA